VIRIGMTGPIGCGKSTVAAWLGEETGVGVIDADAEAHLVLMPGSAEVERVYERFGETLRRFDGTLDRAELGRLVFQDDAGLRDLEAIVHPAVRRRILVAIDVAEASGARAVVIEAIKLVEGGLGALCDEIWLVTCEPETQKERLLGRGAAAADVDARIAAQAGLDGRVRPVATRVLRTDGTPEDVRASARGMLSAALDGPRSPDGGTRLG
jgi:dephospho-CoA kinase